MGDEERRGPEKEGHVGGSATRCQRADEEVLGCQTEGGEIELFAVAVEGSPRPVANLRARRTPDYRALLAVSPP
jgi:hypothetical protein